jgi:trimethylamine--corrinoid protein Co-methyltransferase
MASAVMSDMLLGVGLLNGSTIWSFEQMIMDCEIFSIVRKMMEGIPVDAETLALEAIREAGPGGDFLTHDHTLRNMRGLWINTLLDRRPYTVWESKRDGARDWARDKAKAILAAHHPVPLEPKLEAELRKIILSSGA